jgi:hypothetical protein
MTPLPEEQTPWYPGSMETTEEYGVGKTARLLGISVSGASRILSGGRVPNRVTQRKVSAVLGWPIGDQAEAVEAGDYASGLKRAISAYLASADAKVSAEAH